MQFRTSVIGRTLPRAGTAFRVALEFQRRATPTQGGQGAYATRQTSSLQKTDLDARQMQPASTGGRGVDVDSLQDPPGINRSKRLREDGRCVGVQIILHHPLLRSAVSGMSLRHVDMMPAGQRFDHEEDAHTQSRSVWFVLVQPGAGAAHAHEVQTSQQMGDSLPLHAHPARLPGTRRTAHRPPACTAGRGHRETGCKQELFARRCLALSFPGRHSHFQSPSRYVRCTLTAAWQLTPNASQMWASVSPALTSFQQGICSCEGSRVGPARVENRVMSFVM